jgi:O-acetyl-ADP-ribose deacetylase (regulator of RNase III)
MKTQKPFLNKRNLKIGSSFCIKKKKTKPGMVIHTCNPSYSGGRDQEDRGSKPTQENSSQDPLSKKTLHKIRLVAWIKVKAVSSRPVPHQKKKKS